MGREEEKEGWGWGGGGNTTKCNLNLMWTHFILSLVPIPSFAE